MDSLSPVSSENIAISAICGDNAKISLCVLERIEGLAEVLYAANSGIDNGAYQPCERSMQNTAEIIRVLAKQALQVVEHIRITGGES